MSASQFASQSIVSARSFHCTLCSHACSIQKSLLSARPCLHANLPSYIHSHHALLSLLQCPIQCLRRCVLQCIMPSLWLRTLLTAITCLMQLQLASCIADPQCFENLACLQLCNGRQDEAGCQVNCVVTALVLRSMLQVCFVGHLEQQEIACPCICMLGILYPSRSSTSDVTLKALLLQLEFAEVPSLQSAKSHHRRACQCYSSEVLHIQPVHVKPAIASSPLLVYQSEKQAVCRSGVEICTTTKPSRLSLHVRSVTRSASLRR